MKEKKNKKLSTGIGVVMAIVTLIGVLLLFIQSSYSTESIVYFQVRRDAAQNGQPYQRGDK